MKTYIKDVEGFEIYFEALPEDISLRELLPEQTEEELEEIQEENEIFLAKVTAEKAGIELGIDYLGGCIYKDEEEFYTTYKDDYFTDMVNEAVKEAKTGLKDLVKELTTH